jgi:membrane associated rhomboid family serine protease
MILPLKNETPIKHITYPYVAAVLIGLSILVFLWKLSFGESGGGVARWSHVGGLIMGCVLITPNRQKSVPLFAGFGKIRIGHG